MNLLTFVFANDDLAKISTLQLQSLLQSIFELTGTILLQENEGKKVFGKLVLG